MQGLGNMVNFQTIIGHLKLGYECAMKWWMKACEISSIESFIGLILILS